MNTGTERDARQRVAGTVEISVKGRKLAAAAVEVEGMSVAVTGRYIKVASLHDEDWTEYVIKDPDAFITTLKDRRSTTFKPDIFTFAQKLPHTDALYRYPLK